MEGKAPEDCILEALATLNIEPETSLLDKYQIKTPEEDPKTNKKKAKKVQIAENDSNEKAQEKVNKLLDDLSKTYENMGKQLFKARQIQVKVEASETDKEKANKQKTMYEGLFNNFKKKYDDEIKNAEQTQKDQEEKRKAVIDELQERIKAIQGKYEEAGKIKIEKFRQNETLKHQLSKYEPHLVASESLADAQLKKKSIQIEIQMTTLKQKIEMMNSFKNMREDTQEKLKKAYELDEKIQKRLNKINAKEEEHKLGLAKAHLVFEQYKKVFNVLKVSLPQKEKQAFTSKDRAKKGIKTLEEQKQKSETLEKQYQTHLDQFEVLKKLEQQLQKQIQE